MIKPNARKTLTMTVTKTKTALAMRSGNLEVLATPSVVAHMEQAAARLLDAAYPNKENVGGMISIRHFKPTPVGMKVKSTAKVKAVEDNKILFEVSAQDESGPIAEGEHVRYLVDKKEFLAKAK